MLVSGVKIILNKLNSLGYEAYVVGGAVRNYLLGINISDYDITTNALPEDVENIFKHTLDIGKKYGTINVEINGEFFEVTTYRSDGLYSDGRRPEVVFFSDSLEEDLKRRDFTINSICMDVNCKITDLFEGRNDLDRKIIRCIGDANNRFREDALRMMRAIRFMTQLNFTIEKETFESIRRNSILLEKISVERIQVEFNKILLSKKPSIGIRKLIETKLINVFLPEILNTIGFEQRNPYHDKDVFNHIMEVLDNIEPILNLRLSALLHDIEKPKCFTVSENGRGHFYGHHIESSKTARNILNRLKYSNEIIDDVCILIRYHYLKEIDMKDKGVKRFINNVGIDRLDDMFKLNIADISGKANPNSIEKVEVLREKCKKIINNKEPLTKKDLLINGHDLINIGITDGKKIGYILDKLMNYVLDYPDKNDKEFLIEFSKTIK